MKKELLDVLACPKCKGDLVYDKKENNLICSACRLKFKIEDDVPNMLIEEATQY